MKEMNKFLLKVLISLACFSAFNCIAVAASEVDIADIFNSDGTPKEGSINGVKFISAKENGLLTLALFDGESIPNKSGDNYWFLSCNSYKDNYNMNAVICGAQRGEFKILLGSLGYIIEMENKPRGGGRYIVAFDKQPSFEATYRIIDKVEVKKFLAKMIDSKKMQYSYKNEKNKYISNERKIQNTGLTISLLKDMRDYY
ncbi:hypothetical protein [Acinetobacter bereziniae]|uniref:hypothetical protein n=1 Tax=Acinetobacter bereziniae TaxID=106648 RepID=UPI0018FFBD4D|nr:hypothetical protein [Acinetobacter bereziniae]MBJ9905855.1 hypothetical protein [Acinetobacter bereziniae]MBJ9927488.1 hypothetical protein [Acinetobacter bereziniae]